MSEALQIRPGEFRIGPALSVPMVAEESLPVLEKPQRLVERVFPGFIRYFGEPTWVYYPCSGTDVSPSQFFREVLYVDKNEKTVDALHKAGYKAYHVDATTFKMDRKTELLILFNPELDLPQTRQLLERVNPQRVICNNYHNTTDHIQKITREKPRAKIDRLYHIFDFQ